MPVLPYHPLEDAFADPDRFETAFSQLPVVREAFRSARSAYRQRAQLGDDLSVTGPSRTQCALSAFLSALQLQRDQENR